MTRNLSRRAFLASAGAAATSLALARRARAEEKPESLVYSTYGGDYGQWVKEDFEDPFTAATGIRLIHDIGENPQRYAKLKTYRERPKVNLIQLQDRFLYEATRDGLLEEIDYAKLPHAAPIPPIYRKKTWLGYSVLSIGIIYNRERVAMPPRQWTDLVDERYKGRIFIDDFNHFGLHITLAIAMAEGGGYQDIRPGLKVIKEIKDRLNPRFISTSQEGMKLLGDGEVDVAMWQSSRAFILKRKGKPLEYAVPETGDVAVSYGNAVVKGAGYKEWGEAFIDFTADPRLQGKFVSGPFPTTPTHPDALGYATPEAAKLVARPPGAKQIELDYGEVLPRLDEWTKLWNQMIEA
ncbi:MAG: extracellular solute-binding protein [Alphaproteobacteria bacterium]